MDSFFFQYPAGYQKEKENKNEVEEAAATPSKAKRKRKSQGSGKFCVFYLTRVFNRGLYKIAENHPGPFLIQGAVECRGCSSCLSINFSFYQNPPRPHQPRLLRK